jgi:hypothetical protein
MRRMLKMLLRPEGATVDELVEAGIGRRQVARYIIVLTDEKGWDIRGFPRPELRREGVAKRKHLYVYKVVGKMRWNGTYRSFVNAEPNR